MSFVNFSTKEITSKIVYYGPGLCGKTTTLQYIYDSIVPENKGQLVSLATDVDRTIYFDFLPLKLGKIQSFSVRIQLYTVPGQVRYNSTRKLVLSGTDGVVFVADSQHDLMEENLNSLRNLVENLKEHGLELESVPLVLQFNKRDLPNVASIEELNTRLNPEGLPAFETCATTGEGVLEGLKVISKLVMRDINRKGVINRRRILSHPVRNKTDSILRPLVGLGEPIGPATIIEEYIDPFLKEQLDRSMPLSDERQSPYRAEETQEPPVSLVSFSLLFRDEALARQIQELELCVARAEATQVRKLARELYYAVIEDDRHFPPDMTESSRISMLGVSLRKYAHFYRLLSQQTLTREECLFLLHFVIDVHFGKGMP